MGFIKRRFSARIINGTIATITLNRADRKNPLTFESYAELRDLFQRLKHADDVKVVLLHGAGGNFCSGGDVHEIIGPLTRMDMKQLLAFTRVFQSSSFSRAEPKGPVNS